MARDRRRNRHRDERNDRGDDLHARIFELLLDKVSEDPYPSTTHLDMLESLLRDDDEREQYAGTLMEKVADEKFPSLDHLRRLQNLG
jgi:hypothetical protein